MPAITYFGEAGPRAAGADEDYVRTYERRYKVRVDSPTTGPKWILQHVGPQLAATYSTGTESDAAAIIKGTTLAQDPNDEYGLTWDLTATYGPWDPYRHASSPLLLKPLVTQEGVNFQKIADRDYEGKPILNTAGDPYDPAPEMDETRCVIRVQQNLASFTPATVLFYSNKINSDTWFGMLPHVVKCDPPKAVVAYHQACGSYWQVEFNLVVNPNVVADPAGGPDVVLGWDKAIPSRGFRQLVGGSWARVANPDGSDVDEPAFLDSSGAALTPPVDYTNIVFTRHQIYRAIDFTTTFGFDPTMFF